MLVTLHYWSKQTNNYLFIIIKLPYYTSYFTILVLYYIDQSLYSLPPSRVGCILYTLNISVYEFIRTGLYMCGTSVSGRQTLRSEAVKTRLSMLVMISDVGRSDVSPMLSLNWSDSEPLVSPMSSSLPSVCFIAVVSDRMIRQNISLELRTQLSLNLFVHWFRMTIALSVGRLECSVKCQMKCWRVLRAMSRETISLMEWTVHKNFRANSWRPLASSVTIGGRLSAWLSGRSSSLWPQPHKH